MNGAQSGVAEQLANVATSETIDGRLYGQIGKPFRPYPLMPENPELNQEMPWRWIPSFKKRGSFFSTERLLTLLTILLFFCAFLILVNGGNAGNIVGFVLFLIASIVCAYARVRIGVILYRRRAICVTLGRQKQALQLWNSKPGPYYESKDEFFKNYLYRVLRDGTIEKVDEEAKPAEMTDIITDLKNANQFAKNANSVILNVGDNEDGENETDK